MLLHCNSLCLSVRTWKCKRDGGKESERFAASCLPLYISPNLPISLSCLGMDVSVDSLPASLLYISVNISFSHCPFPISTPSCLLCHASFLSSPLVHLAVPFITSWRNQKRFCPCLCLACSTLFAPAETLSCRREPASIQALFLAKE